MQFNQVYYKTAEKQSPQSPTPLAPYSNARLGQPDIEKPIYNIPELGQSVTEGSRFGSFIQTATGAIRSGAGKIELQLQMGGGGELVGAGVYGKEAREALREMARANQIEFPSVHTPTQIGNLSGFAGPERGFDDQQRKVEVDEVKNAIDFAADTSGKGAVVVHTGEFQRPISEQKWAVDKQGNHIFKGYEEEPEKAIIPLVDKRTGHVTAQVRKNQIVARAKWNKFEEENPIWDNNSGQGYVDSRGHEVRPGDYIDHEGNWVDMQHRVPEYDQKNNTFKILRQSWSDFEKEANERNEILAKQLGVSVAQLPDDQKITPAEAFLHATTETQERIAEGWAGNYTERLSHSFDAVEKLKKALAYYEEVEKNIPKDEWWKIMKDHGNPVLHNLQMNHIIPVENKLPTELIKMELAETRKQIADLREMVTGQKQQAEEQRIMRDYSVPVEKYAKEQTNKSYAELGIYAMDVSKSGKHVKDDIFVAPENIFPEMGYGSHPEELIELVKNARESMAKRLMEERNYSEPEAKASAERFIKATLDTQHVGMWRKHFVPLPGETENQTDKRFEGWYMEQVQKIEKEGILGHLHVVDSLGRTHTHLPPGQGNLPIKDALKYLKEKGYKGALISEGFAESQFGPARILTKFWEVANSSVYSQGFAGHFGAVPRAKWTDVEHSYFGQTYPPYFIFGGYAPSNDWSLWSQVPME